MKILGMEVYRRRTDEEIIEGIRKNIRCPRWYRCFHLGLLLLYIGLMIFGGWLLANIRDLTERPHQYDLGLVLGIIVGVLYGGMVFHGGLLFYRTIRPTGEHRIERLLLRYHDELRALGRIPQRGESDSLSSSPAGV